MSDAWQNRADNVSTLRDAIAFLEDLSTETTDRRNLYPESLEFISAMSGFLEDFNEANDMSPAELRRLCIVVNESLHYE